MQKIQLSKGYRTHDTKQGNTVVKSKENIAHEIHM